MDTVNGKCAAVRGYRPTGDICLETAGRIPITGRLIVKKRFLSAAMLASAALAVGAIASPASAGTLRYTFTGFCDGLTLVRDGLTYGGERTGCASEPAGGISMRIRTNLNVYIDVATTNGSTSFSYFLDIPHLQWWLYETSGGVYSVTDSGTLTPGAPTLAQAGLKSTTSTKATHPLTGPF